MSNRNPKIKNRAEWRSDKRAIRDVIVLFQKQAGCAPADFKLQIQDSRMGKRIARSPSLEGKPLRQHCKGSRLVSNLKAGSCLTSVLASPIMQKRGTSCSAVVSLK